MGLEQRDGIRTRDWGLETREASKAQVPRQLSRNLKWDGIELKIGTRLLELEIVAARMSG